MPRVIPFSPKLRALQVAQDWVLSREQALGQGLTRHVIENRLSTGDWQVLLPSIYLCHPGTPSRRQMLIAAQLFAGPDAAIDGADACRYHGIKTAGFDEGLVRVVAPWGSTVRSRGFVRVRRTTRPIHIVSTETVRYLQPADAVVAACRSMCSERAAIAALSDAAQRRIATDAELLAAHLRGSARKARLTGRALEHVLAGTRSVVEADARVIFEASDVLPRPIYNCLLRLPQGRLISPDALIVEAGLVHEINGRTAHARLDLFEDMQERHDAMTAAGLTVLHNSPRRLWHCGPEVLAEMERCYARLAGRGLPAGVEIVRLAA